MASQFPVRNTFDFERKKEREEALLGFRQVDPFLTRPDNTLIGLDPILPDPILVGSGHDPIIGSGHGLFLGPDPLNRSSVHSISNNLFPKLYEEF